ncbi:MAG: hypothetical protein K2G87_06250 [Oscillospiraceae bacterium]|nr:hypothetical protein [Oscillospiraceae bacterium]
MKIDAWWFENKQDASEVLQPEIFVPKTCFGVYAEFDKIAYPFTVKVTAELDGKQLYQGEFTIKSGNEAYETYEARCTDSTVTLKALAENISGLPDKISVETEIDGKRYTETVKCEYARLYGKITDFDGKSFPALVQMQRVGFDKDISIGVWSDKDGKYSAVVPKGCYNSFFIDDESYGKTSLESWCWHMLVDRDEKLDFKIGNGEIYSLSVWCNNGGGQTLFFWFRPMILGKKSEYEVEINDQSRTVTDISPELETEDITVTLNGRELKVISLQRIYETTENSVMPAYILQTERPSGAVGKQTAVVEYNTEKRSSELGYTAQSQGRVQFYFRDSNCLALM